MSTGALRIGIVAGEESGDLLAADLMRALAVRTGRPIELVGVGGAHLQALGLRPVFDPAEIALMGVLAVVSSAPRLLRRLSQTVGVLAAARLDCLVTVDSPEFALRVAARVRKAVPSLPTVHYVSPSVWGWRPERAAAMRPYIDHVLCLLPFEPAELRRLGGPPGTFVGHRLSSDPGLLAAAETQRRRPQPGEDDETALLVLPGSRRGEATALIESFGEAVAALKARGNRFRILLPTLPRLRPMLEEMTAGWALKPSISTTMEDKWAAFGAADAALAASGTVTLELALAGVPVVSAYKVDPLGKLLMHKVKIWSASLPNLIADRPVIPEFFNEFVRPGMLARHLETLMRPSLARTAQLEGFAEVRAKLRTERPAGELAAEIVLDQIRRMRG